MNIVLFQNYDRVLISRAYIMAGISYSIIWLWLAMEFPTKNVKRVCNFNAIVALFNSLLIWVGCDQLTNILYNIWYDIIDIITYNYNTKTDSQNKILCIRVYISAFRERNRPVGHPKRNWKKQLQRMCDESTMDKFLWSSVGTPKATFSR